MVKGISYGQRQPPLTVILKTILERYPDGGQILKEIIQNADDAGATTVKFLLDSRANHYGTTSLYKPELAKFQGPALYAQNDALFTEDDWEGIESLMQSKKKEDPLKVGRFGIGFNSVYHITDLPSIVSGERLAFLDPHEVYFGRKETGQSFNLNDPDTNEKPPLAEFYDQFSPFEGVLDCSISKRKYKGTLFRFPLRNEPSDLSKKTYNTDKVRSLFTSLQQEASLILLFLKNVEKICIYETDDRTKERLLFSVQIKESCRAEVRRKKQEFLRNVHKWTSCQVPKIELSLELTVEEKRPGRTATEHKWLVHHRIGAGNARLRQLATDLALLPWMGFATPLTAADRQAIGPHGGRIFCFLPLPLDSDAKTELPVHVHGAFGLSDNRRELKWPGGERQSDEAAEWNQLLLDLVGADAYAKILVDLVQSQIKQAGIRQNNAVLTYEAWPRIDGVQFHWRRILKPMFKILVKNKIFWCRSGGGRWVDLGNALLDRMATSAAGVSQEARDVVQNVLIKANENLVTVPGHILQAIDKFMKQQVTSRDVTPTYVRDLLKNKQHSPSVVSNFDRREKLLVLEYVVSDSNMGHLQGVPLLPLANGTFKDFAGIRHINLAVYVASKEIPRNLFPNMDEKFLDDTRCYTAHKSLQSVAQSSHNFASGPTQLVKLGKEMVRDLLTRLSLPRDWFTGASDCVAWYPGRNGHPPASWMSAIWFLLRNEFPYDISSFENIPLIDTGHDSCHVLMKLRRNSRVIRQTAPGSILPGPVVELLRKAGCIVLSEVPQYMQHSCLPQYVALPTPDGVLQVLSAVRCNSCIQLISSCTLEQKKALRDFLAGMNHSLTRDQIVLLQLLPVFDTMDSRSTIAVRDRHVAPRDLWLPPEITVTNAHQIITVSDNNSLRLLGLLGRTPSTQAWFLKQCVLPSVANHLYSHNKVSILMHWVLERLPIFSSEDDSFTTYLQGLQFVPVGQDSLAFPTAVFDPREPLLQELFSGETEKFPQGTFVEPQILNQLQLVGIRNVMSLQPSDVVSIARKLTNFDMQQAHKKAQALLKLLNCRCGLLNQKVFDFGNVKPLKSVLESVDWVPARRTSPKPYPSGMEWYGSSDKLFKPSDVARSDRANLVGSSMPVLEEEVKPSLSFAFGWGEEPPIRNVIQQLKIAVTLVPQRFLSAANFQLMLGEIYQQISSCATKSDIQVLRDPLFPAWVWHGNGFAAPSQVIVSSLYDINVEPHLFALPKSYSTEVNQFFQKCGARNIEQESDLLDVLTMIKDKHEEGSKTEGEGFMIYI